MVFILSSTLQFSAGSTLVLPYPGVIVATSDSLALFRTTTTTSADPLCMYMFRVRLELLGIEMTGVVEDSDES